MRKENKEFLKKKLNAVCCITIEAMIDLEVFIYPIRDTSVRIDGFAFDYSHRMSFEKVVLAIKRLIEPESKNRITLDSIKNIISSPDFYISINTDEFEEDFIKKLSEYNLDGEGILERETKNVFQKNFKKYVKDFSDEVTSLVESDESKHIKSIRDFICHNLSGSVPDLPVVDLAESLYNTLNKIVFMLSYLYQFVFDKDADFFKKTKNVAEALSKDYWETIKLGAQKIVDTKIRKDTLVKLLEEGYTIKDGKYAEQ